METIAKIADEFLFAATRVAAASEKHPPGRASDQKDV